MSTSALEISRHTSFKDRQSKNIGPKVSIKPENLRRKLTFHDSTEVEENKELKMANLEKQHLERHQKEVEDREFEEKKRIRSKQDIFKWLHLPPDSLENELLKKMVRIRILEILSDVPSNNEARHFKTDR